EGDEVRVVALLEPFFDPVAARGRVADRSRRVSLRRAGESGLEPAGRRAPIVRREVAVVALFGSTEDAVAAKRRAVRAGVARRARAAVRTGREARAAPGAAGIRVGADAGRARVSERARVGVVAGCAVGRARASGLRAAGSRRRAGIGAAGDIEALAGV